MTTDSYTNWGTDKPLDGGDIAIASVVGGATAGIAAKLTAGAGAASSLIRLGSLGAGANTTQYVLTENYHERRLTCDGLIWAGATGAVGGFATGLGNSIPSSRFMDYWKPIPLAEEPGTAVFRFMGRQATANRNAAMAQSALGGRNALINPLSNLAFNFPRPEERK